MIIFRDHEILQKIETWWRETLTAELGRRIIENYGCVARFLTQFASKNVLNTLFKQKFFNNIINRIYNQLSIERLRELESFIVQYTVIQNQFSTIQ